MYYVGIDFGTTNSSVAVIGPEEIKNPRKLGGKQIVVPRCLELEGGFNNERKERELMRTTLLVHPNGEVTIGGQPDGRVDPNRLISSLKRRILKNPDYEVTIDNQVYSGGELVSIFIEKLLISAGIPVDKIERLVLSIPVEYGEDKKHLMEHACSRLGITPDKIWFVDEPIAILWFYEKVQPIQSDLILVYDFGGGTLDLAVMKREDSHDAAGWGQGNVLVKKKIEVAGDDLDEVIIQYFIEQGKEQKNPVCEQLDLAIFQDEKRLEKFRDMSPYKLLKRFAEMMKIELSRRDEYVMSIPSLLPQMDTVGIRDVLLTKQEFEKRAEVVWRKIRQAIVELGEELAAKHDVGLEKIETVFLSGGSSKVPYVLDLIETLMPNATIRSDKYMQTSICRGNAGYGYDEEDGEIRVTDVVNQSFGIYSHYDQSTFVMIKSDDQFPVKRTVGIATTKPYQQSIEIRPMVSDGSGQFVPIIKAGKEIKYRMQIKQLQKMQDLNRIKLTFELDRSQKLRITAYDNHFQEEIGVEEVSLP